ncbi:MAG: adenosine kinase, partial [Rickettsiales bacterium]|nr:adenosine kinase [Rickettsiales bacterium]
GGSVANSLAGLASLGAKTAFIGKVRADQLGQIFTHDMHAVGTHFESRPLEIGPATASCLIYVTPDAQRTMATYIGACSHVSETDIEEDVIAAAGITYVEGYLWDMETAKSAIRKAITIAHEAGRKVAFTLSDTFCVERHRDEFLALIENDIDILFANESEIKALFQTEQLQTALTRIQGKCDVVAVTRSEKGSMVVTPGGIDEMPTEPVANVVDTTGAGDLYAAGFLYGMSRGWKLTACAQLGNRCAGQIITQLGARSQKPLSSLVA